MQTNYLQPKCGLSTLGIIPILSLPLLFSCSDKKNIEKPNVIYILMDDLGYGELGCYGQTKIETPNIDKLRGEGMKFTQHYSGAPVSGPSRCVLMTGMHTGHSYIRGNDEVASRGAVWDHDSMFVHPHLEGQMPLKANTYTIGRLMQDAGYETACIGKWGLGYPGSEGEPNKQGFDFFYGYNCQRQAHTYYPPFLWKNDQRVYLDNKVVPMRGPSSKIPKGTDPLDGNSYKTFNQNDYSPDFMFSEMIQFVDKNKANPFFMMVTTPIPHVALQAPEKWVNYYREKFGDEEPYLGNKGYFPSRYPKATYAAMITYFDEQVGKLVEKLKADGIYDNTLIIFTSDNGATFNGGTESPWFNSGGVFKSESGWGKCSLHEGGIRVPFIAVWKDQIEAGITAEHISGFQDFLPTLAEITNTQIAQCDGISYLPTLLGKDEAQKEHPYIYFEYPEAGGWRSIREGDWKLIAKKVRSKNPIFELYNLADDVREQKNLVGQNPDKVEQLKTLMKKALIEAENPRFRMEAF